MQQNPRAFLVFKVTVGFPMLENVELRWKWGIQRRYQQADRCVLHRQSLVKVCCFYLFIYLFIVGFPNLTFICKILYSFFFIKTLKVLLTGASNTNIEGTNSSYQLQAASPGASTPHPWAQEPI